MPKKTYQFGLLAEKVAISFLQIKGYKILHHRFKTKFGEIDLIAQKGDFVIFIEVKARKKSTNIEEVLSQRQINRMKVAAQIFIDQNQPFQNHNFRFDFIEINSFFKPTHHINFIS